VESYRVSWSLVESLPVTIEVGFLSESASLIIEVSESDNKVEFLQIIE
jgi:hypothetical protein